MMEFLGKIAKYQILMPLSNMFPATRTTHSRPQSSLRVGLLSPHRCGDRNWLNTITQMKQALMRRGIEIVELGDAVDRCPQKWVALLQSLKIKFNGVTDPLIEHHRFMHRVHRRLAQTACDVILAPAAMAEVAHLRTEISVVYLSDTTIKLHHRHHGSFWHWAGGIRAKYYENCAIAKASQLIYPAEQAAYSAIEEYGANYRKVSVIPILNNQSIPAEQISPGNWDQWAMRIHLIFIQLVHRNDLN